MKPDRILIGTLRWGKDFCLKRRLVRETCPEMIPTSSCVESKFSITSPSDSLIKLSNARWGLKNMGNDLKDWTQASIESVKKPRRLSKDVFKACPGCKWGACVLPNQSVKQHSNETQRFKTCFLPLNTFNDELTGWIRASRWHEAGSAVRRWLAELPNSSVLPWASTARS